MVIQKDGQLLEGFSGSFECKKVVVVPPTETFSGLVNIITKREGVAPSFIKYSRVGQEPRFFVDGKEVSVEELSNP